MDILITAAWIIGYLAIGAGIVALLLWKVPWRDSVDAGFIVVLGLIFWPFAAFYGGIGVLITWSGKQVTKILKKESNA